MTTACTHLYSKIATKAVGKMIGESIHGSKHMTLYFLLHQCHNKMLHVRPTVTDGCSATYDIEMPPHAAVSDTVSESPDPHL